MNQEFSNMQSKANKMFNDMKERNEQFENIVEMYEIKELKYETDKMFNLIKLQNEQFNRIVKHHEAIKSFIVNFKNDLRKFQNTQQEQVEEWYNNINQITPKSTLSYQDALIKKMSLTILGYEEPAQLKTQRDEQVKLMALNVLGEESKKRVEWKPKITVEKRLITLQELKNAPDDIYCLF